MREKSKMIFSYGYSTLSVRMIVIVTFLLIVFSISAQSQIGIKGTVISEFDGMPLIGVNVVQKGTTNGTVTNFDGVYEMTVPVGTELEFSYIGFHSHQEKVVAGKNVYNVSLREDSQSIEEVVVIGYGVQKKKLVTGATVQVSGDDLQKLSTSNALGALQSQTPGVMIVQNGGQPGDGFKVTIRGLGTVGTSSPLYVIDGVAGGDINALNPSDIESIDVLKDAASAAIYGARAANGVILVTTKQGKAGKVQLSYDGFWGIQNVYKMPNTLNAREYMMILDEVRTNEGNGVFDWSKELPGYLYDNIMSGKWNGTNWFEEIKNKNAVTQNHAINLTGGSDVSRFAMGFSYSDQEGTLGKPVNPNYTRYTTRINSEHVLLKVRDFDAIKIGENLTYTYNTRTGIQTGDIHSNDLQDMLVGCPLLPLYNSKGEYYDQNDKTAEGWVYQGGISNPIANMALSSRGQNISKKHSLQANVYAEIQPIKNLKLRSVFGYKMNASSFRSYDGIRYLSSTNNVSNDQIVQEAGLGYSITWENTISYNFRLNHNHNFDAVIGQSIEKWGMGEDVNSSVMNSTFPGSFKNAYIDNGKPTALGEVGYGGAPWGQGRLASFFGRVNYNFKETYMASVVLRADGSSNFFRGNRWGYFPSVSAGWVITNENFMESLRDNGLDFFKIRASWGQNGNSTIDAFQYLATIAMDAGNSYYFGDSKEAPSTGSYADILANPDISWETSEQLDLGFDARILDGRLGIAFDWYKKTTKDWLVRAPQLASYGTAAPFINGGDVQNKGVELGLNWNDNIGDFTYGVSFNISHNKNEVTRINNTEGIIHGPVNVLSQNTTEMYRAEVGLPIGYFWGYKTEGVYQNQADIDARKASGKGMLEAVQPGDLIFADTNKDGGITEEDKVMIGNPHPDVTGGLTLTFGYKGFDLSATAYGAFGHQIAKGYRSFADSRDDNYTRDIFGRWHGEGTSNKLPRLTSGSPNWQYISDIHVEDADYVKLSNLTIGYDCKKLFPAIPFGQARLYITAQNLFTITGYSGMDPEIGYGDGQSWVSGIDIGSYPSPRTFLIGINLKF